VHTAGRFQHRDDFLARRPLVLEVHDGWNQLMGERDGVMQTVSVGHVVVGAQVLDARDDETIHLLAKDVAPKVQAPRA